MDRLIQQLQKTGLTGNESRVYVELLRKGSISAHELSKALGMDRTLTYQVLNHLIEKGIVNYIVRGKRYFEAADPQHLMNSLKEREALLQDIIPELAKIVPKGERRHSVMAYEGKQGLRTVMNLALQEKELCSFGATGRAFDALYEMPRIARSMSRGNFNVRLIGGEELRNSPVAKQFSCRYLDFKNDVTTSIFGKYISIHVIKGKPVVILIRDELIAKSYRDHFEILWKTAKTRG